ncbi:hypothetical protein EXIGLDRAFT_771905 [Exidia glandulosa HHB12029]|uniref:Uncharacterized protein n=1 Tax=Exidia glandulosa HHB12029 TaxID=1314781 RepID=A0A165FN87_EXIGL|nr:hypothetical protein EXIGLDRAFT_771905 [Exidia glandulosa HHB12029]
MPAVHSVLRDRNTNSRLCPGCTRSIVDRRGCWDREQGKCTQCASIARATAQLPRSKTCSTCQELFPADQVTGDPGQQRCRNCVKCELCTGCKKIKKRKWFWKDPSRPNVGRLCKTCSHCRDKPKARNAANRARAEEEGRKYCIVGQHFVEVQECIEPETGREFASCLACVQRQRENRERRRRDDEAEQDDEAALDDGPADGVEVQTSAS